jgi:16S rRNA processing protein RimM
VSLRWPDRVAVARILRARGLSGQVVAEPLTDDLSRFARLTRVYLSQGENVREARVGRAVVEGSRVSFNFVGIDGRRGAAQLVGAYVEVDGSEVPPPEDGSYYDFQLVGLAVVDEAGTELGKVAAIDRMPSDVMLRVETGKGEHLVPMREQFVSRVDLENERIVVVSVPGLLGDT